MSVGYFIMNAFFLCGWEGGCGRGCWLRVCNFESFLRVPVFAFLTFFDDSNLCSLVLVDMLS